MTTLANAPPGEAVGINIDLPQWGTNTAKIVTEYDRHIEEVGLTKEEFESIVSHLNSKYEEFVPKSWNGMMYCLMLTIIGGIYMQECVIMKGQQKAAEYTKKCVD